MICTISLPGQSGQIDVLKAQLKQAQGTERVDILNQLSLLERRQNVKQASSYAQQAYDLSEQLGYHKGIYKSAYYLGQVEMSAGGSNRKAINFTTAGIDAAQRAGNKLAERDGWRQLSSIYRQQGKRSKQAKAELELDKLNNQIRQEQQSEEIEQLRLEQQIKEDALDRSETKREQLSKDYLSGEKERLKQLAEMSQEMIAIQLMRSELENDSLTKSLELKDREQEVQQYDERLHRQRLWLALLILGFLAAAVVFLLLLRNNRLKRIRVEEKSSLQQQLMIKDKLASLGQLTAGIAHEIKNPLNFVNNFAEGSTDLAEELSDTISKHKKALSTEQYALITELVSEFKQNAFDILYHGKRADRIVSTMMQHTRNDKGEKQMTNLNAMLEDNLELSYHAFRAKDSRFFLTIHKEFDTGLPDIRVAVQGMSRALLNIFNNACDAVLQKWLKEGDGYQPEIRITTKKTDSGIHIQIVDNGIGISREDLPNLFTPFFTTKPTGEGNAGLGLSISYDIIVQEHQGQLEIDSMQGQYTTVSIYLPVQ